MQWIILSTSAQCSFWCYIGEVLQLICRQWQKSAVGADSAVFTQQPRAVTHRSCRQRTTPPQIHPDFVPSVRWPPPRAPFPGISLSLEWKLATQKAPVPPRVEAQQTYAVGPKTGNHPRIESTGAKPAPSGALSPGRNVHSHTMHCNGIYSWFVFFVIQHRM